MQPYAKLEKSHFMVKEDIVLGHRISEKGIEANRAKVEVIERLPPPISVRCEEFSWACELLPEVYQVFFKKFTSSVQVI